MVSIIMLTYNREKLVSRAIECVLSQTYTNYEFIIVNNGSSDKSGDVADDYAQKDSRIKVIHKERGNIGSGRNAGLDTAKGEYIAFIDDDDWFDPDFIDFMYQLSIENDADIAICGANDKIYDERHVYTPEEALIVLFWRKRFNAQFPTKLIKHKLLENIRFSENAKYDDIELMPRVFASANRIAYHGIPKYTFYRHDSNNSAWTSNHSLLDAETLEEYLDVYRKRTEWLCKKYPDKAETWQYFQWSFWLSMIEKVTRLELEDCYSIRGDLKDNIKKIKNEFIKSQYIQDFEREWLNKYM